VASLKRIGDKEALARAYFHLAHASFLLKSYPEAKRSLAEASRLAEQLGYEGFLSVEGRNAGLLLQYAASEEAGSGRYARVLEKVRALDAGRLQAPVEVIGERGAHARPEIAAYAFGEARVLVNDRRIRDAEWRSGRAKELFFYLLCSDMAKTKEQIAVALWPDLSPAKSTSNFHINLYRARHALFPGVVALEEGRYRISDRPGVWFDVAEFLAVADRVEEAARRPGVTIAVLEEAASLCAGPFLPGIYSEWAEEMRRELETRHLKVLHALATSYIESGDFSKALALFEKIAAVDPYYEDFFPEIERKILERGCEPALLREFKRSLTRLREGDNPAGMKRLPAPGQ
jgi:DNA-binding SARP family transcriptional activator